MSEKRVLNEGIDRRAGNPGPVRSDPFVQDEAKVRDLEHKLAAYRGAIQMLAKGEWTQDEMLEWLGEKP